MSASFRLSFSAPHFAAPKFTPQQLTAIGARGQQQMLDRVAEYRNLTDGPAKAYSTLGPIYIPISGVGTIRKVLNGDLLKRQAKSGAISKEQYKEALHGKTSFAVKRNKSSLGGVEVFTKSDLSKLIASGLVVKASGKSSAAHVTPLGQVTPSGKSIKFANRAAYKRALGKSGNRDLQVSGRMLGSIGIVSVTDNSVTIGFLRQEEEEKGRRNQNIDPWFGLSEQDKVAVTKFAAQFLPELAANMILK